MEFVLDGASRAAILLMVLDTETSEKLVTKLDEDELQSVSQAMAKLGAADSSVVERVIVEFLYDMTESLEIVGNAKIAEKFLRRTIGDEMAEEVMANVYRAGSGDIWTRVEKMPIQDVVMFIKNEHPQTTAVILSRINPVVAGRVLNAISEEYAFEVIKRMLALRRINSDVMKRLESVLSEELSTDSINLSRKIGLNSTQTVANIFDNLDQDLEDKLMQRLQSYTPEAAKEINKLMFTFDDIALLDPSSVQLLVRSVDKDLLALALKNADEKVRTTFTQGMSQRVARLLLEDIESVVGSINDSKMAQAEIVAKAKELLQMGAITLHKV